MREGGRKREEDGGRESERGYEAAVWKGGVIRERERRASDWGGLSRNQIEYCSSCSDIPCCYRCGFAAPSLSHARILTGINAHALNTDLLAHALEGI